jgi:segregation and condensation protein B
MENPLEIKIEAILFFQGEPLSFKRLAEYTDSNIEDVKGVILNLKNKLSERGIVIIENKNEVSLGTSPKVSSLIEKITKEELAKDIGKASLETLAIIFYKGQASKREIDYIRGVNSGFILRNLLIRGLVSREEESGERGFIYKPTIELLAHMGIEKVEEMPEFESMKKELESFLTARDTNEETLESNQ